MAEQLIIDLYGCGADTLDDAAAVRHVAHGAIADLGASVVEEACHKFDPIGVSYVAVITTSHLSIHTWPEYGYAAVDVFSCARGVPRSLAESLAQAFGATSYKVRSLDRRVGDAP